MTEPGDTGPSDTGPSDTAPSDTAPGDTALRARLRGIDPMPGSVPVRSPSGQSARRLVEQIVQTEPSPTIDPPPHRAPRRAGWKRPLAAAAAVAAVAVLGVGGIVAFDRPAGEPSIMALDGTGPTDPMAMCLQVTAENLAAFPVAFAGTALEVADGVATLEVTRWYRGGDADRVTIAAPAAQPALIGGVDIEVGGRYLITADQGTVTNCYFSDVASPALAALYDEAFGG